MNKTSLVGVFSQERTKMAEKKEKKEKEIKVKDNFYKGYDMKWLATEPSHPDFYLVAEYKEL